VPPPKKDSGGIELYKMQNAYLCMTFTKPMKPAYQEEELVDVLEATEITEVMDLVVFNDDINTFDHVIDTLIRVCKHSNEQAEQCTMLIHYKGKCAVKNGTFDFLRPMREAICEVGIDARIV
jgi:ATP-dependent Clp protease adaptor protein ClpS